MKRLLFLLLLVSEGLRAQPTGGATDSAAAGPPRREFLPVGHLFEPLTLDPLEAQTYVSVLPVFATNGAPYNGTMVPFAFGLRKPFWRWHYRRFSAEFAVDVASFTQFEIYTDPVTNRQRRQLVNTDYRVGFWYNIRVGANAWRVRLYHLSSHLGDDYMIRNGINFYMPNAVNYEVLDLTYSHERNGLRKYVGLGYGLRRPVERKRLSAQAGLYYRHLKNPAARSRLVGGVDLKVWEQTRFKPGVHGGVGVEFGRPDRHLTFLLEAYNGFQPYSQFEGRHVSWVGVGFYFNPI